MIYAGTGVADHADGRHFLDYNVLDHHFLRLPLDFGPHHGQHLGIFLVELGVGITVTAVMTMIFYAFAGKEPESHDWTRSSGSTTIGS